MKKLLWIILLLSVLVVGYYFVAKNSNNNNDKVVFWTLQMNDYSDYMNKIISEFESQNPDIDIEWIDVPFSEGEKRTLAAILSDNPPSLVNLNPDFSSMLAQKGALEEINEDELKSFNQEILSSLKIADKLFSIPWYATSAITIYNKDLFEKAGINDFPKTYEELAKNADLMKQKTNSYIFMPTISENDTMLKILNKYGISTVSDINSKNAVEVFDMFKTLYKNGLIPLESLTQTHRESLEKYMSGEIASIQAGANFLNMIKENAPSIYKSSDVEEQIKGSVGQNDFSLMNFIVPVKAKNKDKAIKFALYLTNKENQLELAKMTNIIATNQEALNDDYYIKFSEDDLISKARVLSAIQLQKVKPVMKQNKSQKEINLLVNTAVQSILLDKDSTKKILDEVAEKWTKLQE